MNKVTVWISKTWKQHSLLIFVGLLFIIAIVVIAGLSSSAREARQQAAIERNNRMALQDSVRIVNNRLHEAEYHKQTFIVESKKELQELTADLFNEISLLKGDIKSIQKAQAVIVRDTVPLIVDNPSPNIWNFSFDTTYNKGNYERFKGFINTADPTLSRRTGGELGISLITALEKKKDGSGEIIFKSRFPGIKFTEIEGAQIDKSAFLSPVAKQPLITATFTIGQNLATYNYNDKKTYFLRPEVNATAGLSINLNKLLKRK